MDGSTVEELSLRWENGGWVAEGVVRGVDVHYVVRLGPDFRTRQFMLFRDLEDPDLWLATDGAGRWGEVNGVERDELRGAWDIDIGCTPFTNSIPVRALGLEVGGSAEIDVAWIDVETLGVHLARQRYSRVADRRWRFEVLASGFTAEIQVDEHGLVLDYPGLFRRGVAAAPLP